jgi:periplasmic protein TonB
MKKKQPKSIRLIIWGVSGLVALMFVAGAVGAIKLLFSDDGSKRQRQIKMVTLVKPPPPPKVKEKPPEPEIKKKEEIVEPEQEPEPDPVDDMSEDEGPMDDDLGLDADGTAGADGFGLRAKKGGRDLIGSRVGGTNLLRKYGWYAAIIQEDLRKRVNKHMEENGGIPDGNLVAQVKITLDEKGQITDLALERPTGNTTMDSALKEALLLTQVSEPPPAGMPRTMKLKISSKG